MKPLQFSFNGEAIPFLEGMTIASALLLADQKSLRTTQVKGMPRGAFCLMGSCFDCLVTVDGVPNIQACQQEAQDGMSVESQNVTTKKQTGEHK